MHSKISTIIAAFILVGTVLLQAEARPYFYYQAADAPAPDAIASVQQGAEQAVQQVSTEAQKIANQVGQQARQANNYIQGSLNSPPASSGITSHLGSLYEHGSSAMRSVMETVRPDINNLGHDISDFVVQTRDNVNKKIQPIGQTIRPYIDQAQKAVAPYVNQAKEEVPKLIERAGPTLNKAKESISSAWGKLSSTVSNAANQMTSQAQQAGQGASQAVPQTEVAEQANPDAL